MKFHQTVQLIYRNMLSRLLILNTKVFQRVCNYCEASLQKGPDVAIFTKAVKLGRKV